MSILLPLRPELDLTKVSCHFKKWMFGGNFVWKSTNSLVGFWHFSVSLFGFTKRSPKADWQIKAQSTNIIQLWLDWIGFKLLPFLYFSVNHSLFTAIWGTSRLAANQTSNQSSSYFSVSHFGWAQGSKLKVPILY
jgi:hypothetical protein